MLSLESFFSTPSAAQSGRTMRAKYIAVDKLVIKGLMWEIITRVALWETYVTRRYLDLSVGEIRPSLTSERLSGSN